MSFEPNPQQALLLLSMLLAETAEARRPTLRACGLRPELRQPLIELDFIEEIETAQATRLGLKTKGRQWASRNFDFLFFRPQKRTAKLSAVMDLALRKLRPVLEKQRTSIAKTLTRAFEKATAADPVGVKPPPKRAKRKPPRTRDPSKRKPSTRRARAVPMALTVESIENQIREAYLAETDSAFNQRVLLKDLRPKVGVQREDFNQALLSLQKEGKVILMGLDNAAERTAEVEAAALHIAGNPRHLVYFQG